MIVYVSKFFFLSGNSQWKFSPLAWQLLPPTNSNTSNLEDDMRHIISQSDNTPMKLIPVIKYSQFVYDKTVYGKLNSFTESFYSGDASSLVVALITHSIQLVSRKERV